MGLKRTEESGFYDYITEKQEFKELQNLLMIALQEAEELCDVLFADEPTKGVVEEMWLKNRLSELRQKTLGIDIFKQEILTLFSQYQKKGEIYSPYD